jgi:hypothetical protein
MFRFLLPNDSNWCFLISSPFLLLSGGEKSSASQDNFYSIWFGKEVKSWLSSLFDEDSYHFE